MKQVFGLAEPLRQMSPVHIPRGFTQAYIEGEVVEDLPARIGIAHRAFANRDILLIEGTGHAGVGAVIGLSNAAVAAMLGAPAVIVSEGGVGRPIDEIVLNASLFDAPRGPGRRRDRQQGRPRRQARPGAHARARPGASRHPAARRPALPADPVEPDPGDGPRGRPRRDHPSGPGPRRGHRRHRDRGDGARAHAPADRPAQPGHRARRPERRHPGDRRRASVRRRRRHRRPRPGPDRRLSTRRVRRSTRSARRTCSRRSSPRTPTRSPRSSTTCWSRRTRPTPARSPRSRRSLWEYLFIDRVLEVAEEARFD